jgi:hypothetical protein
MPAITQHLNIIQQSLAQTMNEWGEKTQQHCTKISQQLNNIMSGQIAFIIQAHQQSSTASPDMTGGNNNMIAPTATSSSDSSTSSSFTSATATADTVSLQLCIAELAAQNKISLKPPSYKLSHIIQTVLDLWQEWTISLGNKPAVQSLKNSYEAAWHSLQSERIMFGWQKMIIDEI